MKSQETSSSSRRPGWGMTVLTAVLLGLLFVSVWYLGIAWSLLPLPSMQSLLAVDSIRQFAAFIEFNLARHPDYMILAGLLIGGFEAGFSILRFKKRDVGAFSAGMLAMALLIGIFVFALSLPETLEQIHADPGNFSVVGPLYYKFALFLFAALWVLMRTTIEAFLSQARNEEDGALKE